MNIKMLHYKKLKLYTFFFGIYCLVRYYTSVYCNHGQITYTEKNSCDKKEHFLSHPFENECRYAILRPTEPDLIEHIQRVRTLTCHKVQLDLRCD
jgi:hypothetical protein